MAKVLFSAMRNEAPFILEWVAYHQAIGFDRICVVTNDCDDGTDAILRKLSDAGEVLHIPQEVPEGEAPQQTAVALSRSVGLLEDGDWGIFLDADEFLNIKIDRGHVEDLITFLEDQNLLGLLVNWRVFGDSGNNRFTGRYVSADYTRCDDGIPVTQFKTFFKKVPEIAGFSKFVHLCRLKPGSVPLDRFASPTGEPLDASKWSMDEEHRDLFEQWVTTGISTLGTLSGEVSTYDIVQINHYLVRDRASFDLKRARGRGYRKRNQRPRYTLEFYNTWNRNDVEDRTILRLEDQTSERMSRLAEVSQLRDVVLQTERKYYDTASDRVSRVLDAFPLDFREAEGELVEERYVKASSIMEYGSGGSTLLAARNGKDFISVDSDEQRAWDLSLALQAVDTRADISEVCWVDIGPTKEWGYPANNSGLRNYWRYPMEAWRQYPSFHPDLVLINGRMRKACFATTLLFMKQPVTILFDDYDWRQHYHEVERILEPVEMAGRMAVFAAEPGLISQADFVEFLPWFFDLR